MAGVAPEQFDLFSMGQDQAPAAVRAVPVEAVASPAPAVAAATGVPEAAAPAPIAAAVFEMPVEIVREPVVNEASRVIKDAGAELTYNRRNRVKSAKKWSDISSLNDSLKVKETVKSNIWPKIDYQKLIDDGMPPLVSHIVKQVYDAVSPKPNTTLINDATLERYINAVNRVENGLMDWATDDQAVDYWMSRMSNVHGMNFGSKDNAPKSLLEFVFPEGWRTSQDELRIVGANKLLSALQPSYENSRRGLKAIKEGWPRKREAWEIQGFKIVENPSVEVVASSNVKIQGTDSVFMAIDGRYVKSFASLQEGEAAKNAIGPFVLFGKRGFVNHFASEELALASAKEHAQRESKRAGVSDKGMLVESVEREGIARRMPGENITSERMVEEFGLKGVNFGNWMKTPAAREEAQLHLNHAYDSFHDLAEVMGVPPKALSLNGMLGLAIGAQGGGGRAAAHFVPGVNEINLTRTSGAGSLGHEWAHALDHYFAVQAGLATSATPFLTEFASPDLMRKKGKIVDGRYVSVEVPRFGELRPEVALAFNSIVDAMNKRPATETDLLDRNKASNERIEKNINGWLRAIRRDFSGQEDAFDALSQKIKDGDFGDGKVAVSRNTHLSPVLVEMRELYKSKNGRVSSLDDMKSLQSWLDNATFSKNSVFKPSASVGTEYSKNALNLDKEKGGKPYWSTDLEKFARAFDAYLTDTLDEKLIKNQYLSHVGRDGVTVPMGDERTAINEAFRGLVETLEVKEQGAVLFSNGAADGRQGRISMTEIDAEIKRLKVQWPSMPRVTVVRDVKDLPFESPENTDGAFCDGHVYVVANNIQDLKQLQKVMAHECILHHSMEEMLGEYGFSKLHHGLQKLKRAGDPTVCSLADNILSRYGKLPPEIETKEIVARAGEMCLDDKGDVKVSFGFMKSVFAGVAGWLRDHGISVPFTNTELQGIMHSAGQWIKQDRGEPAHGPVVDYAGSGMALNSFGGIRAETAPLEALRVAREMHINGVDDREIWRDTGWTFGFADGKPRFEISDDQANVVIENRTVYEIFKDMEAVDKSIHTVGQFIVKNPEHPLSLEVNKHQGVRAAYEQMRTDDPAAAREIEKYLEHKRLYEAYPEIANIKAGQSPGMSSLVYDDNDPMVQEWWDSIEKRDSAPESREWAILSRAIVHIEKNPVVMPAFNQYERLAGEAEARLTQARIDMTPQERAEGYPLDDLLIPVASHAVKSPSHKTPLANDGFHVGKVLDIADGNVVQKTGRSSNEVVRHLVSTLSAKVEIGDVVEIAYKDGVGVVAGRGVGKER